eukprot:1137212-Rhodomonas_salina.1
MVCVGGVVEAGVVCVRVHVCVCGPDAGVRGGVRRCYCDNSFSGNECAAVAVQGKAQPTMQRNVVVHSGRGGVWLGMPLHLSAYHASPIMLGHVRVLTYAARNVYRALMMYNTVSGTELGDAGTRRAGRR